MAFVVPQMPLSVNVWSNYDQSVDPVPPVIAPSFNVPGNLAMGRREFQDESGSGYTMYALFPAGTIINDGQVVSPNEDLVEIPAGTGRYYTVMYADNVGMGFANEHVMAVIMKALAFPSG